MSSNQQSQKNEKNQKKDRKRRNNNLDPDVKTSKALSWALRHAAPGLGLEMGPDGYVPLAQLLSHSHPKFRGMTFESVQKVVTSNAKQRFSLLKRAASSSTAGEDDNNGEWYIRANQGHSIKTIDPYQLLTPIDPSTLPVIVHGTYMGAWIQHIQKEGLSKMKRTHIHFAKGMPKDEGVISGMRKSCDVFIYIDGVKCCGDPEDISSRIEFLESSNGVVLTAGVDGMLAPQYFSHVLSKSGDILLDQRTS